MRLLVLVLLSVAIAQGATSKAAKTTPAPKSGTDLQSQIQTHKRALDELSASIGDRQRQLDDLHLGDLEDQMTSARQQIDDITASLADTSERLSRINDDKRSFQLDAEAKARETQDAYNVQIDTQRDTLRTLEDELAKLQANALFNGALWPEIPNKQQQVAAQRNLVKSLENDRLAAQQQSGAELAAGSKRFDTERTNLENELQTLKVEYAEAQTAYQNLEQSEQQGLQKKNALQKQIAELNAKYDNEESQLKAAQKQLQGTEETTAR